MNKPTRILVAGGAGFIGTNVALECLNRGYVPVVLDNMSRPGTEDNAKFLYSAGVDVIRMDITDITRPLPDDVDGIIHLAGQTGIGYAKRYPLFDFTANTLGTIRLLEHARVFDIPLIFASTNKVYAGDTINAVPTREEETRYVWDIDGIDEDVRTDGRHHTLYGASKLAADTYCREYFESYGVKTVVNRMSCIYGYFQNGVEEQGWLDHFVRSNLKGLPINIYGDGKQVRDMCWGEDLARLYLEELEQIDRCAGQAFTVGGGKNNTYSVNEALAEIEAQTGSKFHITYGDWRDADQKVYISDISKAKRILGWEPRVSPREGLSMMIERYKDESR